MALQFRIERFGEVDSTNLGILHALEAGEPEGLVWRARMQMGGYGRQGRSWSSPEGGLYQSLLLRPEVPLAQLPTLAPLVALSAREALLRVSGASSDSILVKWPNGVVCSAGKLVGISLEMHAGGVCVGIGVNVHRPAEEAPVGGKNTPAYVEDLGNPTATVDDVGDEVLAAFGPSYERWQREGFAAFVDDFRTCDALCGQRVELVTLDGSQLACGTAAGIDEQGRLLVDDGQTVRPLASGEAHIVASSSKGEGALCANS